MSAKKNKLIFSLLGAANRIERKLDRALSNMSGVSFTEYFLLKQLKEQHHGAATRVDLALAVHLTPSAVTRALKPLEKIGYIKSTKSERDARQSIATLTPAGEELVLNANNLVSDEVSALPLSGPAGNELLALLNNLSPT